MQENEVQFNINSISNQKKQNLSFSSDDQRNLEVLNTDDTCKQFPNDITVIQCFWGNDIDRIASSVNAIKRILKTIDTSKYIFVEAQKKRSLAIFQFLLKYGVKYIFKEIHKETEDIFLKMPLWNIGASCAKTDKFCFLDSDVYFKDDNWIKKISDSLDKYDVISPSGFNVYVNSDLVEESDKIESIGHLLMEQKNIISCHSEFGIGMTRNAYEKYGKFDSVNYLDDQWFWFKLIGKEINFNNIFQLPYNPIGEYNGYPLTVGSTDLICYHINHKDYEYSKKQYMISNSISYCHCDYPMQDILYDKKTLELPVWSDNSTGRIMHNCFKDLFNGKANNKTYAKYADSEYGIFDENHSLFICSIYRPTFKYKNISVVKDFYQQLLNYCASNFTFVCFSNQKIDGIDTIPYNKNYSNIQILSKSKIRFQKNSTIIYFDINTQFEKKFKIIPKFQFNKIIQDFQTGIIYDF